MSWFYDTLDPLIATAAKGLVIYLIMIIYTRLSGLRTYGKLTSFDFAITIAYGSLIATIMLSKNVSAVQGTVALGVLILLQYLLSAYRKRHKRLDDLVSNTPLLLVHRGKILRENMLEVNLTEENLVAKLREANAFSLSEVHAVVMETTGDVSVLHTADKQRRLDDYLLIGVTGLPEEL